MLVDEARTHVCRVCSEGIFVCEGSTDVCCAYGGDKTVVKPEAGGKLTPAKLGKEALRDST